MNAKAQDQDQDYVTKERALAIAQETANATVQNTFTALGADMSSPASIIQLQVDLAYLRRSRRWSERLGIVLRISLATGGLGLLAKLVWEGLKAKAGGGG